MPVEAASDSREMLAAIPTDGSCKRVLPMDDDFTFKDLNGSLDVYDDWRKTSGITHSVCFSE